MRLNPFNTGNIKVRSSGGRGGAAGGIGCGTLVLAALGYFIFGADPMQTIGMVEGAGGGGGQVTSGSQDEQAICTSSAYSREACNGLESLNQTWAQVFDEQNVRGFQTPTLDLPTARSWRTGCGTGQAAMGPFYCPADQTIYIDTGFYDQLAQMSGTGGDFARLYVLAHEYGHHVQYITGVSQQIRSAQQANPRQQNALNVRMELHADCYAGVWAGRNRNLIEPGDLEEGMAAASAIGDDVLTQGRVSAEQFTHGTSAQRTEALRLGIQTGDDRQCDQRYLRI